MWYVSESPCDNGGPDSSNAPFASIVANMVESALRIGMRSFVLTKTEGAAIPMSP